MTRLMTLATVAACCAIAAGCGSTSSSSPVGSSSGTTGPHAHGVAGKTSHVTLQNGQFRPQHVTVPVSSTVLWTNSDKTKCAVGATSGAKFKSPAFAAGSSFTFTVTRAGTIHYHCSTNPGATGTITVTG